MNTPNTAVEVRHPTEGMPNGGTPPMRMVNASSQVRPIQLQTLDDMWRFAGFLVASGQLPSSYKGDAETKRSMAVIAIQLGAEVGLMPMQSVQSIYVVNGIPTLYGDSQLALVRQSGLMVYIKETTEGEGLTLVCHCEIMRKGDTEPTMRSFSWKDAIQAGLSGKDTYKGHPKRMCAYRARAFAIRDTFPDVLKGLTHTYEEMIDVTPERAAPLKVEGKTDNMADLLASEAAAGVPAAEAEVVVDGGEAAAVTAEATETPAETATTTQA